MFHGSKPKGGGIFTPPESEPAHAGAMDGLRKIAGGMKSNYSAARAVRKVPNVVGNPPSTENGDPGTKVLGLGVNEE
jgi:hypothetical protein